MIDNRAIRLDVPGVHDLQAWAFYVTPAHVDTMRTDMRMCELWQEACQEAAHRLDNIYEMFGGLSEWESRIAGLGALPAPGHEWFMILSHVIDYLSQGRPDMTVTHLSRFVSHEILGTETTWRTVIGPHFRTPTEEPPKLSVIVSAEGYVYGNRFTEPVSVGVLFFGPQNRLGLSCCIESCICQWFRDDVFLRFLRRARNVNDVAELMEEAAAGWH